MQKVRRYRIGHERNPYLSNTQYFRVVEQHKDGYPHIHAILQTPIVRFIITNDRYIEPVLRTRLKADWPFGFIDTRPCTQDRGLLYALKYLTKNTTRKTIFKKILPKPEREVKASIKNSLVRQPRKDPAPTHFNGVKLASWSRNFDFTPFSIMQSTRLDTLWSPLHDPGNP
jgi:hypothetical protein